MKKLTWYHNLGFYENPFSIKPAAYDDELIGYDELIEKINDKVASNEAILLSGKYGMGKTSILKGVIHKFRGKGRVAYYNCNKNDNSIDFDKLLINAGGFFRKLFRIRKKNMILLLDEAQEMNKKDMHNVLKYYQEGFFCSIIIACSTENFIPTQDLSEAIGKNKFKVAGISSDDAISLVRKRIGNIDSISDKNIAKIFSKEKNPRLFLKNCEDIFRYTYEQGREEITPEDIDAVLG